MKKILKLACLLSTLQILLTACSLSISSFSNNLNKAVMANDDPTTVSQAIPAYLVLMDGLLEGDPEDEDLLLASAKLLSAYAGLVGTQAQLVPEDNEFLKQQLQQQQKSLINKAYSRATLGMCFYEEEYCNVTKLQYKDFEKVIKSVDEDDIGLLYSFATVWASWIQVNSGDWNATAKLPQIKHLMQRVLQIDETWQNAGAHMYLGVLNSLLPASLGGKPELGQQHFVKAIELTQGKNQMAKVLYAEYYARLVFDENLHNQLLKDVLSQNVDEPSLVLMNTLAKKKAEALQLSAVDYF